MPWVSKQTLIKLILDSIPNKHSMTPFKLEEIIDSYPKRILFQTDDVFGLYNDGLDEYEYYIESLSLNPI